MRRKGVSRVELLVVVLILAALAAIVIPRLTNMSAKAREEKSSLDSGTDVSVTLVANPTRIVYKVLNQWGYDSVEFSDLDLDGDLDGVISSNESRSKKESWDVWQKRYEEIKKEVTIGFPGVNELFQKQKEN